MSDLLEESTVSERDHTIRPDDMYGNKLSQESVELLTAFVNGDSVPKSQLSKVFEPIFRDARNHPVAPAAKLMLEEFEIVDANRDGAVDGKEIFRYVEKNEERLWNAPKIKQENEPWYRVSLEDAKAVLSTAGKIVSNLTYSLSPYLLPSLTSSVSPGLGQEKLTEYLRTSVPRDEPNPEVLCGTTLAYIMMTKKNKDGQK
jgi:hypothetical protein